VGCGKNRVPFFLFRVGWSLRRKIEIDGVGMSAAENDIDFISRQRWKTKISVRGRPAAAACAQQVPAAQQTQVPGVAFGLFQ
jgi:hypothetical protein